MESLPEVDKGITNGETDTLCDRDVFIIATFAGEFSDVESCGVKLTNAGSLHIESDEDELSSRYKEIFWTFDCKDKEAGMPSVEFSELEMPGSDDIEVEGTATDMNKVGTTEGVDKVGIDALAKSVLTADETGERMCEESPEAGAVPGFDRGIGGTNKEIAAGASTTALIDFCMSERELGKVET